ncbi:MAG: GrdX family protein [Eggerthellaceae bacterium]|nr:GrdX family protein [Eggerthellaceae bacterium]
MIVVTNNPLLHAEPNALFVDGSFRDVLVKVRDLVYSGHELVTHPLFASLGMMFSPYRTVVLGESCGRASDFEMELVEHAIQTYDQATEGRVRLHEYDDDYAWMDRSLYYSAMEDQGLVVAGK